MNAKPVMPDVGKANRILAISDIHGSAELLRRLLRTVGFCDSDFLMLLGDYIEKGPESLATLRYVMELCKLPNVCAISGNCDTIWEDVRYERYHEGMDKGKMQERLLNAYDAEFTWLCELPHIIDTPELTFVHAGISNENLAAQDANECMMYKAFMDNAPHFSKYVVAGHWPTVNYTAYTNGLLSHMPIINRDKRVVSIDGGNVVKRSGQLNCLIYTKGTFSFAYIDDLPSRTVNAPQTGGGEPVSVTWMHNEIELLRRGEGESTCILKHTGERVLIPNDYLFEKDGAHFCRDYTSYIMPLNEGDRVSLVEMHESRALIKRDGILGWVNQALLTVN